MSYPIEIRKVDRARDYADICQWWSSREGWAPVPWDHLSPTGGFIATLSEKKLCALWLYLNGSALGQMEFLVTNPDAPVRTRVEALKRLVEFSKAVAWQCGVKSLWTSSDNRSLIHLFKNQGFQVTDTHVTHLIARLEKCQR